MSDRRDFITRAEEIAEETRVLKHPLNPIPDNHPLMKAYEYLIMLFLTHKQIGKGTAPVEYLKLHLDSLDAIALELSFNDVMFLKTILDHLSDSIATHWMQSNCRRKAGELN